MLLKCEDCMVTFESESLKDCPSCGTTDFIYQLSDNQVLAYENQKLKKENKDLLSANINMHDALDLKSERIQELKKQLAMAVEALKNAYGEINSLNGSDNILEELEQALAEIGGEDE
ncbi:Zn-ribbon containing protein [Lactococcus petauri]|uniref:OapC/ArvC family zinc-ribbon domain-containing protein n=1 Tax=Lactococcus petauri TaxID=1940789 RepID=UPI003852D41A